MEEKLAPAYEGDARYKRLLALVKEYERRVKSPYTHKLPPGEKKIVDQALKDLKSIGAQLEGAYLDQLPLVPDVGTRKVVQQK